MSLEAHAQSGNCVINGGINNGIQIQNCPVIEAAPTPSFHIVREEPIKKNDDGTFTREALIEIDAPYVPNDMVVLASGPTVTDLNVTSKSIMFGGRNTDPNERPLKFGVYEPSGQYTIAVKTSDENTEPSIQIVFNVPNINWGGVAPAHHP